MQRHRSTESIESTENTDRSVMNRNQAIHISLLLFSVSMLLTACQSYMQRGAQEQAIGQAFSACETCPELVPIYGGDFYMGSMTEIQPSWPYEYPLHVVRVQSFAIGKYPVTQAQWQAVMGDNPSAFINPQAPVENISWDDAQAYVKKLSEQTGQTYRLPTEAEWEYAARAGYSSRDQQPIWHFGDDVDALTRFAWVPENSKGTTHPVGLLEPSLFGVYDMYGNVWEWVQDCWHDDYVGAPQTSQAWEEGSCNWRVIRGGSWRHDAENARAAFRYASAPTAKNQYIGLRVAMDWDE